MSYYSNHKVMIGIFEIKLLNKDFFTTGEQRLKL